MSKVFDFFGKTVLAIVLIFIVGFLEGYTLMKLWVWFIVSTFHITPITIIQALGIGLVFSFLKLDRKKVMEKGDESYKDFITSLIMSCVTIVFVLGAGWVLKLWMPVN